jgi:hypothetical protein
MRITQELISKCEQYLNAIEEFHLDFRGKPFLTLLEYKIPFIENLELTRDQFGTMDLTGNEVVKIPLLPKLVRLTTLLLGNNKI